MKKILAFVLLIVVGIAGLKLTAEFYLAKTLNMTEQQVIRIPKGASLTSVARQLAGAGFIEYPRLLVKIGQVYGYSHAIKYGEYELGPEHTYRKVLEMLVKGDTLKYKVTFVEGEHIYSYANLLEAEELCSREKFLRLVKDRELIQKLLGEDLNSFEGYLFPETYYFSKYDGCRKIISTMVGRFLKETKSFSFQKSGLNRHQIVTLASIVEKETGAAFERPMISSVFHNRMRKGMRLQTDPTIIYGIMDETGKEISNIRKKDILRPTAYNTYVIPGLPPGPIGNPGIEAIKAAINPATTEYIYFVSRNDGTHVFTKKYKDHVNAVRKFQLNPKMREGKSWRNLKKKVQ